MTQPDHEHGPPIPADPTNNNLHTECKIGLPVAHTHEHVGWRRYRAVAAFLLIFGLAIWGLWETQQVANANRGLIDRNKALIDQVEELAFNTCQRSNQFDQAQRNLYLDLAAADDKVAAITSDVPAGKAVANRAKLYRAAVKKAGTIKPCIKGGG